MFQTTAASTVFILGTVSIPFICHAYSFAVPLMWAIFDNMAAGAILLMTTSPPPADLVALRYVFVLCVCGVFVLER